MYTATIRRSRIGYSICRVQQVIENFIDSDENEIVLSSDGYESLSSLYSSYYSAINRMRKSSTVKVKKRKDRVLLCKV